MKFSYEAARPGVKSLAQAFLKPTREDSEINEIKGLANIDYLRAKMGESQAKEKETSQRTDYLNDPETFVSQQSGVPLPLAKKFSQYLKSGDYGKIQSATPNDDEGNPNPVTAITEAPELAPFVDKLKQAFQTYGATRGATTANPEQIAGARGAYQGQDATAEVQNLVRGGKINDASALNQGSKIGNQIKVFDNIGNTGAVYAPGSGEVVAEKNSLLDAFKNNGKNQPYVYSTDANGNKIATFVPGGPADPAVKAAATSAKQPAEVRRMNIALRSLDDGLNEYEKLLKDFDPRSTDQADTTKQARAKSLVADLQLQFKEAQALGALTGPDVTLMEKALADPGSIKGAFYGTGGLTEQLKQVRNAIIRRKKAIADEFGTVVADTNKDSTTGGSSIEELLKKY